MKLNTSLLIVTLACGTLWAQAPANTPQPASKNPPPAAKNAPAAKTPATPATTMAPPPPKPERQKEAVHRPVVVPYAPRPAVAKAPVAPKPHVMASSASHEQEPSQDGGEVKPASAKDTTRVSTGKMRDPFVSPVMRSNGVVGSGCDTGKRCLVVDEIVLKGIVKSPTGFIAVVENPAKRAYFMRENDPVFNGKVVKITFDTVVFQEEVQDKVGKQSMREVVKKVNAPIV